MNTFFYLPNNTFDVYESQVATPFDIITTLLRAQSSIRITSCCLILYIILELIKRTILLIFFVISTKNSRKDFGINTDIRTRCIKISNDRVLIINKFLNEDSERSRDRSCVY